MSNMIMYLTVCLLLFAQAHFANGRPNHANLQHETLFKDFSKTDICQLPKVPGMCRAYQPSYFFDQDTGSCQLFIYGGCGGNANKFRTKEECKNTCIRKTDYDPYFSNAVKSQIPNHCKLAPAPGPCFASMKKYYYNSDIGKCQDFVYGGCMGNSNKFETLDDCETSCHVITKRIVKMEEEETTKIPRRCQLPKLTGPCRARFELFYFDYKSGKCGKFVYGGCRGNSNRFGTLEQCESTCKI